MLERDYCHILVNCDEACRDDQNVMLMLNFELTKASLQFYRYSKITNNVLGSR